MPLKLLTKEERKANERFRKLIARLNSKREPERLAAQLELREEWPDGLPRLLASYGALTHGWRQRWRWCVYGGLWFLTGIVVDACCALAHAHFSYFTGIFFSPLLLGVLNLIYGPKARNFYARNLMNFDNVEIIGPLVDAPGFRDEITQQEARRALVKLLPQMQADDAHLLNGEQRERLRQMLFTEYTELIVSILKAYEHLGDAPELEAVERLLHTPLWDVEMREAAEACLPFLQWRAQQMHSSQTLLRASEPAITSDALLRPATPLHHADETQLLRISGE